MSICSSTNHQLAEFFRSHDHFTKLTTEEFEFVSDLLLGKSVQSSFASLPTTFTPLGPQRTPSSLLTASLSKQPPSLIVPPSTQKKKLLFITEESKVIYESPKPLVQPEPTTSIVTESSSIPESRPMTSAAKHLMASLLSMDNEESEGVDVDVEMSATKQSSNKEALPQPQIQVQVQHLVEEPEEPAPPSLLQFDFDLSEYQNPKVISSSTVPTDNDNFPKFNFEF